MHGTANKPADQHKLKALGMGLKRGSLALGLALMLAVVAVGDFRPTAVDLLIAPYKYSFVDWEVRHLPDKWLRRARSALTWDSGPDRGARIARVQEFFELGLELRRLERQIQFPSIDQPIDQPNNQPKFRRSSPPGQGTGVLLDTGLSLEQKIVRIKERRRSLAAEVEETIEAEVTEVLASVGLTHAWGVFPPVDAVFFTSPHVLVLSPRDRIDPQRTALLNGGLSNQIKEEIEEAILEGEDLAALVENTGGVAVYPSVVADGFGLRHAVVTTSHEWLHQWFFFRPLGRNFWSGQEMAVLNETAATIAGEEIGKRVFAGLTGPAVDHAGSSAPPASDGRDFDGRDTRGRDTGAQDTGSRDSSGFDFDAEMRETRARVDELLAQEMIEEAEAYMEERRQLFVANGHLIRKINQAYFAFRGTYATSPASVSPIGDQMRRLRAQSKSLEEFLRTVAGFGSYQEFLDHLADG